MAGAARLGDILGPGGVLVSPVSFNVLVNGRPVALDKCRYTPHPCCGQKGCPPAHCSGGTKSIVQGVLVNGQRPLTKGAIGDCGHKVQSASSDVIFN